MTRNEQTRVGALTDGLSWNIWQRFNNGWYYMTYTTRSDEDALLVLRTFSSSTSCQCSQTRTFMKYRRRSHSFKLLKCQFMFTMPESFVYESIFEYSNMSLSKKGDHTKSSLSLHAEWTHRAEQSRIEQSRCIYCRNIRILLPLNAHQAT